MAAARRIVHGRRSGPKDGLISRHEGTEADGGAVATITATTSYRNGRTRGYDTRRTATRISAAAAADDDDGRRPRMEPMVIAVWKMTSACPEKPAIYSTTLLTTREPRDRPRGMGGRKDGWTKPSGI